MWGARIQGATVLMRPITEAELPLLLDWSADPEVLRLAGVPYHAMAPGALKTWWEVAGTDPRSFHWGLEWEGRFVGRAAIYSIDWTSRHGWTATLVGDRSVWRRGIATETIALRTEFAFRQLDLHKLKSAYADGNQGSAQAQRRAGYHQIARAREHLYRDGQWHDAILTELLREDWEHAQPR